MDIPLIHVNKKEKEDYETTADDTLQRFHLDIDVKVEKTSDDEYVGTESCQFPRSELSYEVLRNIFEEKCSYCGHFFKTRYLLLQHNLTHLSVALSPVIVKQNDKKIYYKYGDIKIAGGKMFCISKSLQQCRLCTKILTYRSWNSHLKEVHSTKKYTCDECNKMYKSKIYLRRHIIKTHVRKSIKEVTRHRTLKCPLCPSMFENKACLHVHKKTCHSNKVYQCKVCGSKLKCYTYLLTHMRRVHYNDGKEHKCNMCHKKFRSPRYLRVHQKNSHNAKKQSVKKVKIREEQTEFVCMKIEPSGS